MTLKRAGLHLAFSFASRLTSATPAFQPPTSLCFHRHLHSPVLALPSPSLVANKSDIKQWGLAMAVLRPEDAEASAPQGFTAGVWCWDVFIKQCTTQYMGVGVAALGTKLTSYLGRDFTGWSFQPTGEKWTANVGAPYGPVRPAFEQNDVLSVEVDMTKGTLAFYKNHHYLGVAFKGIHRSAVVAQHGVFPAVTCYRTGDEMQLLGLRNGVIEDSFADDRVSWRQTWRNGTRHGYGVIRMRDGSVQHSAWRQGVREPLTVVEQAGVWTVKWESANGWVRASANQIREYFGKERVLSPQECVAALQAAEMGEISAVPSREHRCEVTGEGLLSPAALFTLSPTHCAAGIVLSPDLSTATCTTNNRCMVLGSRCFTEGRHYWEVAVNDCDFGTVFIGVAARLAGSSHQCWRDYGFVNNRTFQDHATECYYGVQYSRGDVIGVLLDLDVGELSFFKMGKEFYYSHHNVLSLGVAAHHLRGREQHAHTPLYPSFGFKRAGDSISVRPVAVEEEGEETSWWRRLLFVQGAMRAVETGGPEILPDWMKGEILNRFEALYKRNRIRVEVHGKIGVVLDTDASAFDSVPGGKRLVFGQVLSDQNGWKMVLGTQFGRVWYMADNGADFWYFSDDELKQQSAGERPSEASEAEANEASGRLDWAAVLSPVLLRKLKRKALEVCESAGLPFSCLSLRQQGRIVCEELSEAEKGVGICFLQLLNEHGSRAIPFLPLEDEGGVDASSFAGFIKQGGSVVNQGVNVRSEENVRNGVRNEDRLHHITSSHPLSLFSRQKDLFLFTTKKRVLVASLDLLSFFTASADLFERPFSIPEIKVNRVMAQRAVLASPEDAVQKSVFAQLVKGLEVLPIAHFRRDFCHAEDAGQKRAFFVRLIGEGVYDSGGPYREIIGTAAGVEAVSVLGLAKLTANCENGLTRDEEYVVADFRTDSKRAEFYRYEYYWGLLIGLALRGSVSLPLPLSPLVLKMLCGEKVGVEDLRKCEEAFLSLCTKWEEVVSAFGSIREVVEVLPVEEERKKELLLGVGELERDEWCVRMMECMVEKKRNDAWRVVSGVHAIVPAALLALFSPEEMHALLCGSDRMEASDLRRIAEYADGVRESDVTVQRFWRVVAQLTRKERSLLLLFVCARSRLPAPPAPPISFKIVLVEAGDDALPQSQTCFSILKLPRYSSDEVMRRRLVYAINSATTMELDVQLHDAEGWE